MRSRTFTCRHTLTLTITPPQGRVAFSPYAYRQDPLTRRRANDHTNKVIKRTCSIAMENSPTIIAMLTLRQPGVYPYFRLLRANANTERLGQTITSVPVGSHEVQPLPILSISIDLLLEVSTRERYLTFQKCLFIVLSHHPLLVGVRKVVTLAVFGISQAG